ncbi:transposase family protein [Streptomyces sp. NPDC005474]|uniref:transposase family protein n=1 Tax=Streptomyces sp. NPDC005474 TaxID=3154878 RepID=UPI0034571954
MCRQSATVCLVKSPSPAGCSGLSLAERLVTLPGPRHRRGVRHPLVAVLLIAASAVVAGARSYAAIGQWARSAPQHTPRSNDFGTALCRDRLTPGTIRCEGGESAVTVPVAESKPGQACRDG